MRRIGDSLTDRGDTCNSVLLESSTPSTHNLGDIDDDVTDPKQDQESVEDSNSLKNKQIYDNDGNEYGVDSQKTSEVRIGRMAQDNYSIEDIRMNFGSACADEMHRRGVKFVDANVFNELWSEEMQRRADHNYRMSDEYIRKSGDEPVVNYYDNMDVEWKLYNATDFVKKGSKVGEFRSADLARQAAQEKGDGNYVIEGMAVRDGSYWGYYVVAIKGGKTVKYAKKPVIVHETHESIKTAASNKVLEIKEMDFMADVITAGKYVRARLSKRTAGAIKRFAKAADGMLSDVPVTSKAFPEKGDRRMLLKLLGDIEDAIDTLKGLAGTLGAEDQETLEGVSEMLDGLTGQEGDDDMMGEPGGMPTKPALATDPAGAKPATPGAGMGSEVMRM